MIVHTHDALGHEIKQGSRAWWLLRLGIPTVSALDRVMTPAKREYAKGARAYIADLLAEQMLGEPLDWGSTDWAERGTELETKARQWYEIERGVQVEQVAFISDDERTEGGSPDGLVGEDGGVEIKCYGASHHVRCLLGDEEIASPLQVQGLLRLTGRAWWDVLAYHPVLPCRLTRIVRDEPYIEAINKHLARFKDELAEARARLDFLAANGVVGDDSLRELLAASLA